jgi:hypothetical protein
VGASHPGTRAPLAKLALVVLLLADPLEVDRGAPMAGVDLHRCASQHIPVPGLGLTFWAGAGISSVSWWARSLCQLSLVALNFSEV